MGFFSSIKRLWSSNKTEATPQTPQVPAEEVQAASQPTEAEGGTSPETPPAPDTPQPPAVSETLPETASAGPQQAAREADQPAAGQSFEPDGAPAHAPMTAEPDASPAPVAARTAKDGLPEASTSASAAHAAGGGLPEAPAPVDQPAPQPYAPVEPSGWRATLLLALREAEPRLSVWLSIVLEDLGPDARTGDELWERVRFLLTALGAPENEADAFVSDFAAWAERMEYEEVADFRSELQYRLALALDLEDEEDERSRIFLKLHQGLERTREQLGKGLSTLFASHGDLSADFWDELEELFIMADMGVEAAAELCKRLKSRARAASATTPEELRPLLAAELEEIFRIPRGVVAVNPPEVVLIIGVNGVGKTTTIAKLAYRARMQGKKVLLAAADTFRAAAVEQLGIWAERTGSGFHSKGQNADPAAVAWEAMDIAIRDQYDILFIDTAGRLHTKSNLMDELHKIREVIARKHPGAPHRSILIVDATTGQNALQQTKIFKEAAGIDELILTKLDGTAKGGVAVAVSMQYGIPITYVGLGEKMEDLRPFNGDDFAKALLEQ
ncbi:signal recognition particle-docking protein FtsY [uncultured Bilophila sp.]|uniref:signal recognition particle-docking protein FtsY n=1 Tax=uncultured Bilophila sp. TaxID=529385 RepID=UPI00266F3339|nr:signal recognition particle-docking protein FtsY [uncultured Bilophila sp.]